MKNTHLAALPLLLVVAFSGCNESTKPKVTTPTLVANDTPAHAMERLVGAYERRDESAFAGIFTGDYQYEFSNYTDPSLVTQYLGGWFKTDEAASSTHLFSGATSIDINLVNGTPYDDNSSGVDPTTHKLLATRVDGQIVTPETGGGKGGATLTFVIQNNFNVFYIVRGDSAQGLDSSQPADAQHWYIRKWVDETGSPSGNRTQVASTTWGRVKAYYR